MKQRTWIVVVFVCLCISSACVVLHMEEWNACCVTSRPQDESSQSTRTSGGGSICPTILPNEKQQSSTSVDWNDVSDWTIFDLIQDLVEGPQVNCGANKCFFHSRSNFTHFGWLLAFDKTHEAEEVIEELHKDRDDSDDTSAMMHPNATLWYGMNHAWEIASRMAQLYPNDFHHFYAQPPRLFDQETSSWNHAAQCALFLKLFQLRQHMVQDRRAQRLDGVLRQQLAAINAQNSTTTPMIVQRLVRASPNAMLLKHRGVDQPDTVTQFCQLLQIAVDAHEEGNKSGRNTTNAVPRKAFLHNLQNGLRDTWAVILNHYPELARDFQFMVEVDTGWVYQMDLDRGYKLRLTAETEHWTNETWGKWNRRMLKLFRHSLDDCFQSLAT